MMPLQSRRACSPYKFRSTGIGTGGAEDASASSLLAGLPGAASILTAAARSQHALTTAAELCLEAVGQRESIRDGGPPLHDD
jgi:hypothetical protein